jgi:hypothetical protein
MAIKINSALLNEISIYLTSQRLNEACQPFQNCPIDWLLDMHRTWFSGGSIPSASAHNRKNRHNKRNFIHINFRVQYAKIASCGALKSL